MSLYYDLLPRDEAAPINQVYPYLFFKKKNYTLSLENILYLITTFIKGI